MNPHRHLALRPQGRWEKIGLATFPVVASLSPYSSRGGRLAAAAAVRYGAVAVPAILSWDHVMRWSAEHPDLDSACFGVIVFFGLAFIPALPLAMRFAGGVVGSAAGVGVSRGRRPRGTARQAERV